MSDRNKNSDHKREGDIMSHLHRRKTDLSDATVEAMMTDQNKDRYHKRIGEDYSKIHHRKTDLSDATVEAIVEKELNRYHNPADVERNAELVQMCEDWRGKTIQQGKSIAELEAVIKQRDEHLTERWQRIGELERDLHGAKMHSSATLADLNRLDTELDETKEERKKWYDKYMMMKEKIADKCKECPINHL